VTSQAKDTTNAEAGERKPGHEDFEEAGEEGGVGGERPDHSSPQPGTPFGKEDEAGHEAGIAAQSSMCGCVWLQITGLDRRHQGVGLVKGQGQAFTGDRVEGTRGVTKQREIATNDGSAPLFERAGATIGAFYRCALQSIRESREKGKKLIKGGRLLGPQQGDTNRAGANRGDVGFATVGPVDLDQIRPGFDAEVASDAESSAAGRTPIEVRPFPNARETAVGADQEAPENFSSGGFDVVGLQTRDLGVPAKIHAHGLGPVDKSAVEMGSADTVAGRAGEEPFGDGVAVDVADAAEFRAAFRRGGHAEGVQKRDTVRHDAFTAGTIDGRMALVEDGDRQALHACADGNGEPGRSASYDDEIEVLGHLCPERFSHERRESDAPETRNRTLERMEASFTAHPKKGYQRPAHSVSRPRALSSARDLILMRMRLTVPSTAAVNQAQ
jgi:hypothetical protein